LTIKIAIGEPKLLKSMLFFSWYRSDMVHDGPVWYWISWQILHRCGWCLDYQKKSL